MSTVFSDLRYAVRQLMKNPGFMLTAVVSLAPGIGATTAVFSVIYAALLNPFSYPAADRIVRMTLTSKSSPDFWAELDGPQVRQPGELPIIQNVLAMDYHRFTLTGGAVQENINEVGLIANGFNHLGVPPALGRGILPSDAVEGSDPAPVVVLSYKFWSRCTALWPQRNAPLE
jgi:hypothetical protein